MEYTKDVIFKICYNEESNTIKLGKKKWTSRFVKLIKNHKFITLTVFSGVVFIAIDVVLISNFLNILASI